MFYKNLAYSEKTFYGVTFKPGEIKEVPGFINDDNFIAVKKPEDKPKEVVAEEPKPASQKKEDKKSEQRKATEDLVKEEK